MPRPVALKVLQSTPTDPGCAGPENRLCVKCGLWDEETKASSTVSAPSICFIGDTNETNEKYLLAVCTKLGYKPEEIVFRPLVLCDHSLGVSPDNLKLCRAFLLGELSALQPAVVVALGDLGLAAILGNSSVSVKKLFGREVEIPGLPDQLAYCTYHPQEIRDMRRGSRSIQKNFQIVRDLKRLRMEKLTVPDKEPYLNHIVNHNGPWGFDTEFDQDGVYTISCAGEGSFEVTDIEDDHGLQLDIMKGKEALTAHYIQVDLDATVRLGCSRESWLRGEDIYDTFVLEHIREPNLPQKDHYGVEDVLTRLYRAPNWKAETEVLDKAKPLTWGHERRIKRCGYDAWASLTILKHPGIMEVLERSSFLVEWQHRMIPTYHRIKYAGLMVSKSQFDAKHDPTQAKAEQLAGSLEPYIRETYQWPEFSLTNNGHIRSLLYKRLDMPVIKKSLSGLPSVDVDALNDMIADPLVVDLLEWRKANTLMKTWYGKEAKKNSIPLFERINWGTNGRGYLPVNLGVGVTSTLRRQSNAPNMQNWSKDTRPIVCSRFGEEGRLIWSDYEKLEVFLLADETQDTKLREYFTTRGGYLGLARDLMGTEVAKGDDNYRAVKAVALGSNYNAKPMTIAGQLYYKAGVRYSDDFPQEKWKSEHYDQSKRLLEQYFRMFPKIKRLFSTTESELLEQQGIWNRFGHFRPYPCPRGRETPGFNHLLNQAINFKIQSVAGLVTGIAAVLIEEQLVNLYWGGSYTMYHGYLYEMHHALTKGETIEWKRYPYLCNEVHDELMVDSPVELVEQVQSIKKNCMEVAVKGILQSYDPKFDAHLGVEQEVGLYWSQKEEE